MSPGGEGGVVRHRMLQRGSTVPWVSFERRISLALSVRRASLPLPDPDQKLRGRGSRARSVASGESGTGRCLDRGTGCIGADGLVHSGALVFSGGRGGRVFSGAHKDFGGLLSGPGTCTRARSSSFAPASGKGECHRRGGVGECHGARRRDLYCSRAVFFSESSVRLILMEWQVPTVSL